MAWAPTKELQATCTDAMDVKLEGSETGWPLESKIRHLTGAP